MASSFLVVVLLASAASAVNIQLYNNCPFTIWPGILGSTIPNNGGLQLNAGQLETIQVPNGWTSSRIWARTGCDANYNCDTGFCGNNLGCNGAGGVPPVSLAEFTLYGDAGQDYYDVSLVDGYNLPMFIEPINGTYKTTTGSQYDCQRAGGCFEDLLSNTLCPPELRINNTVSSKTVACASACFALNTDQYCCRGAFDTPQTCNHTTWPTDYSKIFKTACPNAYSYAYDDTSSTYTCRGLNTQSPDYRIQWC